MSRATRKAARAAAKAARASAMREGQAQTFAIRSRIVLAVLLAALLVFGVGGWAARASLSGAVIAQGRVAVKAQVKLVQHRDGGIVAAIRVANGDRVRAGDVLIRLDDTQTRAELRVLQTQIAELKGRRARNVAERDGTATVTFEPGFAADPLSAEIARGELRLFAENKASRAARRDQLSSQVAQYEEQVRAFTAQQRSNAAERVLVADDLERLRPLFKKHVIEYGKIRGMERDLAKLEGLQGEIDANIARVKGQISEARLKILELEQQTKTDAQKDLRDVDGRIAELQERLVAAEDRLSRTDLRAPIAGTVNELSVHTVNGVIAPKETLMSIVPEDAELVVEARLSPTDIDQATIGQAARLRFSAFNRRTTPEVSGEVRTIGAAATTDPATNQNYYLSTISIDRTVRAIDGKPILPGMPVEVFLTTGDRTAFSYLVKPFTDQMLRAFRED